VTAWLERLFQKLGGRRKSLTWHISFLFALISFLVIGAMGFSIDRMLVGELLEANDVLLLGNMSLLRGRLARLGPSETVLSSPRFVDEAGLGYRKLAVAVLDEDRRILRASSEFNIPVSALPEKAIPIEAIPDRVDNALERELRTRFGGLSRQWTAPDGRWYQVLLARLPLASAANGEPQSVLIALSYDRSLPRELLARYRKGLLETLIASVLALHTRTALYGRKAAILDSADPGHGWIEKIRLPVRFGRRSVLERSRRLVRREPLACRNRLLA